VVAEAIGRGGAKERRRVLKSMKGHALQLLTHRDAYLAIMRLVEVTDDTVALQKGLLAELCDETVQEKFAANPSLEDEKEEDDNEKGDEASAHSVPLAQVALHNNGSKLLLRLLAPANTKYQGPEELGTMERPSASSKKDPSRRRQEVLAFLREGLESACVQHARILLMSRSGCSVVVEVIRMWRSAAVIEAVAAAAAGPGESEDEPMYDHSIAHHALKKILHAEAGGDGDGEARGEGEGTDDAMEVENPTGGIDNEDEDEDEDEELKPVDEDEEGEGDEDEEDDGGTMAAADEDDTERADPSAFATALVQSAGEGKGLAGWCDSNRGAFVVHALLQVPAAEKGVVAQLKKHAKKLTAKAKTSNGAKLVLAHVKGGKTGK